MLPNIKYHLKIWPAIFVFLFQPNSWADSPLLDFSLSISSTTEAWQLNNASSQPRIRAYGINWFENMTPSIDGGIELGSMEVIRPEATLTSASYTAGEYIGLVTRFRLVEKPHFSWRFIAAYRYSSTLGTASGQESRFSWTQTHASNIFLLRPLKNTGFFLAADYYSMSGEQRDTGTVTQITTIKEGQHLTYRAGIHFYMHPQGRVSLEWLQGYRQGFLMNFQRNF